MNAQIKEEKVTYNDGDNKATTMAAQRQHEWLWHDGSKNGGGEGTTKIANGEDEEEHYSGRGENMECFLKKGEGHVVTSPKLLGVQELGWCPKQFPTQEP